MSDGLVTIASFETAPEAHFAKGYLENQEIHAFVADEQTGTWLGGYSRVLPGISLLVAAKDEEAARAALDHLERVEHGKAAPAVMEEERDFQECSAPDVVATENGHPARADSQAEADAVARARGAFHIAVLSILFPLAVPFALSRAFQAIPGVESSPQALRYRNWARVCALLATVGLAVAIVVSVLPR